LKAAKASKKTADEARAKAEANARALAKKAEEEAKAVETEVIPPTETEKWETRVRGVLGKCKSNKACAN